MANGQIQQKHLAPHRLSQASGSGVNIYPHSRWRKGVNICSGGRKEKGCWRRFSQLSRPRHCFLANGYKAQSNIFVIKSWYKSSSRADTNPYQELKQIFIKSWSKSLKSWYKSLWRVDANPHQELIQILVLVSMDGRSLLPVVVFWLVLLCPTGADVPIAGAENLWPTPASKIFIAGLQKSNKLQTSNTDRKREKYQKEAVASEIVDF